MEMLLIRHGLPLRVDDAGGPADPALAPAGAEQAEALAGWLATAGLDAVYSSPMRRARETAVPLAGRLGLEVVVDDRLEEFDAHLHFYVPLEEIAHDDPRWEQLVAEWTSPEAEATRQGFRTRVVAAVEQIAGRHRSERIALVCHGGVINAYLSHVLGMDRTLFFEPAYTSVSRVLAKTAGPRQFVSANETPHLLGLSVPHDR